jgi:hypothetical protein
MIGYKQIYFVASLFFIMVFQGANGQSAQHCIPDNNYLHAPLAPQGFIRQGFGLTFYSDRETNPYGGTLHGWGPLANGANNSSVDMVLVQVHWNLTHIGPGKTDFMAIEKQIDEVIKAGKKVYLYPHVAFPPRWANIELSQPKNGWINYFDTHSHNLQLEWIALIAKKYGKDKRITAIRMSTFDHGESWVADPLKMKLDSMAKGKGITSVEFAEPFILNIYKEFLKYSDPEKLLAHGGGLQGKSLAWAIEQGTGHETGTQQLDFGGAHHFPRPNSASLKNGHLKVRTMAEDGHKGLYVAESQCWPGWKKDANIDSVRQSALSFFCSHIVHGVNYSLWDEMIYNRHNYARLSGGIKIAPDWTGRLVKRGDESAKEWNDDDEVFRAAMWARTLLGTTDDTTPEVFVQLSSHYVAALKDTVKAFEHGMIMDFEKSKAIPVMQNNLLGGAEYIEEIFDHQRGYFAKSSSHFYFNLNKGFQKSLQNRIGDLLEVRVSYFDEGNEPFDLQYQQQYTGKVSAAIIKRENSKEWRTACFLLTDPEVNSKENFEIQINTDTQSPLTIGLIRVIKQYN